MENVYLKQKILIRCEDKPPNKSYSSVEQSAKGTPETPEEEILKGRLDNILKIVQQINL